MLGAQGARSQRRRRVLKEELLYANSQQGQELPEHEALRYAPSARWEAQPRWTDFLPQSWAPFLGVQAVVAGITCLMIAVGSDAFFTWSAGRPGFLQLGQHGTLASTWSALLCCGAALVSGLIASLRRHRLDDFRASYRVWWLSVAIWMGLAFQAGTPLVAGLWQLSSPFLGAAGTLEPWWWAGLWLSGYVAFLVRLGWETRGRAMSVAGLLATGALQISGGLLAVGYTLPGLSLLGLGQNTEALLGPIFTLSGNATLFLVMVSHAVHLAQAVETELLPEKAFTGNLKRKSQGFFVRKSSRVTEAETTATAPVTPVKLGLEPTATPAPSEVAQATKPGRQLRVDAKHNGPAEPHAAIPTPGRTSAGNDASRANHASAGSTWRDRPEADSLGDEEQDDNEGSDSVERNSSSRSTLTKAERKALRKEKKAAELESKSSWRDRR